jgi:RecA-family ATPase
MDIVEAIKKEQIELVRSEKEKGLFIVQTANDWIEQAKNRPVPKMLFSEFWFESELCILFADTNLGKSILAVQIGNSISKGENINGFKLEGKGQPVLYFDFELSDKQFENRYSIDFQEHYQFDDNFKRVEINPDATLPNNQTFEEFLNTSVEKALIETNAKILIIDNLTFLNNETEKAQNALPLMKHFKALKSKYGLSILILAHTPKRDLSKTITRNDLAGSKMLINFCDSVFTIGESSQDTGTRYLKQIKSRNTEIIFDAENVAVCCIEKPNNFLQFNLNGFGTEKEHLKERTEKDNADREQEILQLKNEGLSNTEIGRRMGVSEGAVRKWFKKIPN